MCTITANSRNWCCSIKVELPTVCLGLITEAVWANPVLPTYLSYQSRKPDPTNHSTDRIQYKHWKQSALGLVGSGLWDYELITTMCQKMGLPARQTRCFHQPLTQFVYRRVVIIHYQQTLYTLGEPMELRPLKVGVSYKHDSFAVTCGAVFGAPEGLHFYSCFRTCKWFLQLPNTPTGSVYFYKGLGLLWSLRSSHSHHLCLMYSSCSRYTYHLSLVYNLFIQFLQTA